jgi:hypothetical protein
LQELDEIYDEVSYAVAEVILQSANIFAMKVSETRGAVIVSVVSKTSIFSSLSPALGNTRGDVTWLISPSPLHLTCFLLTPLLFISLVEERGSLVFSSAEFESGGIN